MIVGCVAALDEEESIEPVVRGLLTYCDRVVVTNDGSTDATRYMANRLGALVVNHHTPMGIGPSLMDAWRVAIELDADRIVQIDAGRSHHPGEARLLLQKDADIVIGSRFVSGGHYRGQHRWRRWLSRVAALLCNLTYHTRIMDWTSGYRCLTGDAAEYLLSCDYQTTMHAWQIEVLSAAIGGGMSIAEVPIDYVAGDSSFDVGVVADALSVWARSLT